MIALTLFDGTDRVVDDPLVAAVRAALERDGVWDDIDPDGLAELATRHRCAADPIAVARTVWANAGGGDIGPCGLYALVELVEMAARGDIGAASPHAHLIARCFDLVACDKPPALSRVTSSTVYGRRAVVDLGGTRPPRDATPLALAQALAARTAPFVNALFA